ncbi:hypothetical protein IV494_11135 [Kaistella sp. G5-32]|uniref:Uncharacterized protein n=1 Tax=Kaistella gelatinilytica TaxID=2787636 RepID=A0ABS0FDH7_9FLAO|nr:DUF6056 family protein [Kaistella gelatinilytica]MBF8457732.1 hypothetical protein [Kaistella gelatinilytica]
MKKSNLPYIVFILINIAIAISCYYYPVSRDSFYYINKFNVPSPFLEYYNSYHKINPRIGQFFANLVSRDKFLVVIFGVVLFNSFISVLFLNIYRKFPDLRQIDELRKFLWLSAFFILFINYFGEMFYYTPYSTNYTLTHVFYLFYVFVISDYYLDGNKTLIKKIPLFLIFVLGLFIGMSNEHVPPVLVAVSFLFALIYFIKLRKIPGLKLIVFPLSIVVGYAFLFFAPANKIKQKVVGKSVMDIGLNDYLSNWIRIIKTYFYYNRELLLLLIVVLIAVTIWNKKIRKATFSLERILFWGLLFIMPLLIVAVSPLIGTRLLFFSTSILLIILYKLIIYLFDFKQNKLSNMLLYGFFTVFFGMSMIITFRANQEYEMLISEIEHKKINTKDIELDHQLNYFTLDIGSYLNRKIFLESGESYIDQNPLQDTSMERNLKSKFNLRSIKQK